MKKIAGFLLLSLVFAPAVAGAQQRAATPPKQVSQLAAKQGIEPGALRDAALRVAMAVDAGQTAQLWDGASSTTKQIVTREAFIAGTSRLRQPLGAVVGRDWISIRRVTGDGKTVPAGLYGSVEFAVTFAGNRVMHELISFKLSEDGIWRFSGYTLQP